MLFMTGLMIAQTAAQMAQLATAANLTWWIPDVAAKGNSFTVSFVTAAAVSTVALGYFCGFQKIGLGLVVGSVQLFASSLSCFIKAKQVERLVAETGISSKSDPLGRYQTRGKALATAAAFFLSTTLLTSIALHATLGKAVLLPAMVVINPAKTALSAAVIAVATTYLLKYLSNEEYETWHQYVPMVISAVTAAFSSLLLPHAGVVVGLVTGLGAFRFQSYQLSYANEAV
jgi:hypothetical protein